MANTIQIKRGSGAPTSLLEGEMGFDTTNKALYIGDSDENPVAISPFVAVYGTTTYAEITQAISDNKDIYVYYSGRKYDFTASSGNYYYFQAPLTTTNYYVRVDTSNVWSNSSSGIGSTDYRYKPYYERKYAGSALSARKICGLDINGKIQPFTTTAGSSTLTTNKVVNTIGFNPDRFFYYASDTAVAKDAIIGAQTLYESNYMTNPQYTFNADLNTCRDLYLKGTMENGLFYLDNTSTTSWLVQVPVNITSRQMSSYFSTGFIYIYLGSTYSTQNYWQLSPTHPRYIFDGQNLVNVMDANPIKNNDIDSITGVNWSATNTSLLSLVNLIMPVGYIYTSTSSVNPNTLFPGTTWRQIKDTFLLTAGDKYANGATGGSATHTLIQKELPKIEGSLQFRALTSGGNIVATYPEGNSGPFTYEADGGDTWSGGINYTSGSNRSDDVITYNNGGQSQPINILPPYKVVYAWERTA